MRKKILLKAPILTRSGYGEQSRFALRALRSREDLYDIYIHPLQWGQTSWITLQDEERKWIDEAIEKSIAHAQSNGTYDISLQVTIPNEWERIAPMNIGYTAGIESSIVSPLWLQKGNETMDKIVVVSEHAKNSYVNTVAQAHNNATGETFDYRLQTPIESVGYPVKEYDNLPEVDIGVSPDFNFLAVAQFGPRKNLPNTIKWFVEEFHDENVGLIVKTNLSKNSLKDREMTMGNLLKSVSEYPDRKCKIYLIHGDMSDEEMHALYLNKKVSAFLALPHGEGFGLPIFEAAYSGLPVITVGWSGQVDYLTDNSKKQNFYDVSFDIKQVQPEVVWQNVLIAESMWSYAREHSAKTAMRQCYDDITNNVEDSVASRAKEYASSLHERFSEQKMYEKFISCIYDEPQEIDWQNWNEDQQGAQEID